MRWLRGRLAIIIMLLASVLVMAGCASVPTSGPIEEVEGQQARGCQSCVNVEVPPPAPDDKPRQIVEGFLRATSYYQPNYSVAKQFLTPMAAEKWSPDDRRNDLSSHRETSKAPTPSASKRYSGRLHGRRTAPTRVDNVHMEYDFVLSNENGQWRIDNPPPGLVGLRRCPSSSFYQSYDLYFVGNNRSLVP